jgi:hypothetical protein
MQMPQDAINDGPMIFPRMAGLDRITLRKEGSNHLPLGVGKFVAMHGWSSLIHIPTGAIGSQWYSRAKP